METLILDRKNLQLESQSGRLIVRQDETAPRSIPLRMIERIVISARVQLDSRLLRRLAAEGIGLIVIDPRHPDDYALLSGAGHNDASRRIRQLRASEDPETCRQVAWMLVAGKLGHQVEYLMEQAARRTASRKALLDTSARLRQARQDILDQKPSLDRLRGIEGAAAAAWFKAYRILMPESLGFAGRNRRPPRDPVNALLSLSYTLADGLANQALLTAGWDPMIGFYHKLDWSRRSLSSDLLEPLRPLVDRWVQQLTTRQILRPEHFRKQGEACYLNKQGRANYYRHWALEAVGMLKPVIAENLQHMTEIVHGEH